jgi:hypothetical protein
MARTSLNLPSAGLVLVAAASIACGGARAGADLPAATVPPGFWDHWGDGRAEIDSYRLTLPRYGELREGTAVLIFVTEDFTDGQRVKSDGGHPDEYPVLKLNDIRHFQTGIYDYDVMSSTFLRIDGESPIGMPVKTSLSVQEWCGHVYEQLVPRGRSLRWTGHSYFDGEADHDEALDLPAGGVLSEALPIVARGLVGDWPEPGAEVEVPILPSLLRSRFAHRDPEWTRATITRGTATAPTVTEVPAGRFDTIDVTATIDGGRSTTWKIEVAPPHRIVRWTASDGETAELVASERLAYWQMNGEGEEAALRSLGLGSAPAPSAPGAEITVQPDIEAPTPAEDAAP